MDGGRGDGTFRRKSSKKLEMPKLPKGKKMLDNVYDSDVDSLYKVNFLYSVGYTPMENFH